MQTFFSCVREVKSLCVHVHVFLAEQLFVAMSAPPPPPYSLFDHDASPPRKVQHRHRVVRFGVHRRFCVTCTLYFFAVSRFDPYYDDFSLLQKAMLLELCDDRRCRHVLLGKVAVNPGRHLNMITQIIVTRRTTAEVLYVFLLCSIAQ